MEGADIRIPGYVIERHIGSGGMGDVYLARQTSLDRPVAIKILPPALARDASYVQRFLKEAKAAGRVIHENIVAAVDTGEADGRYYFVMEYVDGETVARKIQREGALDEKLALRIAHQVAKGLRHAHQQGLIHRDIKPSNIMLTSAGIAKICDFGLARSERELDLTQPGIVHSSPSYASPEQCRGQKDLDHRTDMYSLGVSLFEMLTGKKPFEGETPNILFIKHVTEAPPSPKGLNPAISIAANQLVLRLLRKQPAARFETYDQLVEAIENIARPKAARSATPPPTVRASAGDAPLWKRPPFIGAAAGVAALVLVSLLLFGGGGKGGDPDPETRRPEARVPREVETALREAKTLQERAAGKPHEYPAVRDRWKRLEERYRGTPHHPAFASALVQFDAAVAGEAAAAADRAIEDADRKGADGRLPEAIQALRSFPAGFAGTEAADRVEAKLAAVEKVLDEKFAAGKENFFTLLSREKWDEAAREIEMLRRNVTCGGEYVKPQQKDELDGLARKMEEEKLLAKQRRADPPPPAPDPSAAPVPPPANLPPTPAPSAPEAPPAEFAAILRSAALRADPAKRAAALAACKTAAPGPLQKAAVAFLSWDDRTWGLVHDRITFQSEGVTYKDLNGDARPGENETTVFRGEGGVRIVILKDGRASLAGGPFAKPAKLELQRDLKNPVAEVLDKYLATLPLEKPESLGPPQHAAALQDLSRKIQAAGAFPADALQLFASAHIEAIYLSGGRPDAEAMKLARLQPARGTDLWGLPETAHRVLLARQLLKTKSAVDLRRALDAASGAQDTGTRLLAALSAFTWESFDPSAVAETFRKLAFQAKDTPIGAFCDLVSKQAKDAVPCPECKGEGRYPCKTCNATGMAPCETCAGTGNTTMMGTAPAAGGGFGGRRGLGLIPCKTCKQKGKVICPTCGGGRVAKCAGCAGAKVRKTIPSAEFKTHLEANLCRACGGTGGVFENTLFSCPACEGLGRFPAK